MFYQTLLLGMTLSACRSCTSVVPEMQVHRLEDLSERAGRPAGSGLAVSMYEALYRAANLSGDRAHCACCQKLVCWAIGALFTA